MTTELDQLLAENKVEIASLKERLKDITEIPTGCDDFWFLRYILSHKSAEKAESACRFSITWLKENSKIIADIRSGIPLPHASVITQFQVVGDHKSTVKGEPIFFVRIGLCNTKGLMDTVPYDDVVKHMMLSRIKTMDYCDKMSRQEGRLVKGISVLDFTGFSVVRGNDPRFARVIGETSKLSEMLFPQLLGQSILVNVPRIFYWTINVIKPLMSKKAVEKMVFCPGRLSNKPITECPFVSQRMRSVEDVPTFLGGKCMCPSGCVGGVPNSQTAPVNEIDADGLASITVAPRSAQTIDLPIKGGMKLTYAFKVSERKVELAMYFKKTTESPSETSVAIIDKKFLTAEEGQISGEWLSSSDGIISITMDNNHSMIRSKNVLYKIDIKEQ